jgi:hypothetical protein
MTTVTFVEQVLISDMVAWKVESAEEETVVMEAALVEETEFATMMTKWFLSMPAYVTWMRIWS